MAKIIINQELPYEMLMDSALLMEQLNTAISITNKMLCEIDNIGLSTFDLSVLTFKGLSEVMQDLQRTIDHAEFVHATIKEMEQKLQALIVAPPPPNISDAFK